MPQKYRESKKYNIVGLVDEEITGKEKHLIITILRLAILKLKVTGQELKYLLIRKRVRKLIQILKDIHPMAKLNTPCQV